ncbi:neutral/alkaline non-lysosomal ceramidase N-terminal domain-containing protein [Legionella sp. km772]|uniref:neutral/alkaline non-lysosomal ceramidase N-terminal domain-containing protein n=1 Tax=Legionella sp. km772 TaxID=2498111 RepID=UPI000F8DECE1|nr:neutral/alkaline non-lysosomal ceramidase N-terminal domain-containing protein [Legionella sp. km772]RUR04944.1 hypothetical protein ELY15_14930 [Legionella sp. km772]
MKKRGKTVVQLLYGISFLLVQTLAAHAEDFPFELGTGIYDITGAAAEINMMGYARPQQLTSGLHSRLWSRAFIIASPLNDKRVVFVSADLGMAFQSIKQGVVKKLKEHFGELYNDKNLMITHVTHGQF